MLEYLRNLIADKKICILGFGREGKSTLALLNRAGGYSDIVIADGNDQLVCDGYKVIKGAGYQDNLDAYDIVFKSPGIVLNKDISQYKTKITSQCEVFITVYRERCIGITGTKGKSTTTTLLYQILKSAGVKCVLGGNIGIPVFELFDMMEEDNSTIAVLELSCHQLEYISVSPHIAVLMNLHEEHLDHYGTYEKYKNAKRNIYNYQILGETKGDKLYCGEFVAPNDRKSITIGYGCGDWDVEVYSEHIIYKNADNSELRFAIPTEDIRLIGIHNYFNIGIVFAICNDLGLLEEDITKGLIAYNPLPHRLEYVGEYDGVKYYDDSISTIGETAISATRSIKDLDTILIGGMDRGIDYSDLVEFLPECQIGNIIFMYETGKRIYEEIRANDMVKPNMILVSDLTEAVAKAKALTKKGKACVMSPAAASYGYFKNFEERGDVYKKLVSGEME